MTASLVAYINTDSFSYSLGGRKSEMDVTGLKPRGQQDPLFQILRGSCFLLASITALCSVTIYLEPLAPSYEGPPGFSRKTLLLL